MDHMHAILLFFNYAPENHDNRLVNEKYIRDFCQVMRFQTKDLVF